MSKTDGENNRPVESLEENPEELPVELTEQEELPEEQTAQEELSAEQSEQEELPEEPTADSDTSAEEEPDPAPVDKEALKVVTHPTRRFEYVVPKETFQQHIRSKHRTTVHSGTTKMVTDEELEEASLGYVFSRSRRRKHHRSWWRRRPLWQRVLIILTAVILALAIFLGSTYLIMREIGRGRMHDYDAIEIVAPVDQKSGEELMHTDQHGRMISYKGKDYVLNENIVCITFIGVDNGTDEDENLRMSDAIYLVTIDVTSGKVRIVGISRDTMADVDLYSSQGKYIDTEHIQLSYAYSYHNDEVTGGQNTNAALSHLFFGYPFKNYFAINLDALDTINNSIGGVTLTSQMTFVSPLDGRTVNQGEIITLRGKEAEYYIRYRDTEQLDSNNDRMQRQKQYILAFFDSIIPAVKKDFSRIETLYRSTAVNSDSNLTLSDLVYLASIVVPKLNSGQEVEYVALQGDITWGEHAEMNITYDDAIQMMLDTFYMPVVGEMD